MVSRFATVAAPPSRYGPRLHALLRDVDDAVLVRDPTAVESKLASLASAGLEHVHVVSDFDRTLTQFEHQGRRVDSCHGVIDSSPLLGDAFRAHIKSIFDKYYPLEISPSLSHDERERYMVEWWTQAHSAYFEYGLREHMLPDMLGTSNITLRAHADRVIKGLRHHRVPLFVLSAGIANVIELFLDRHAARPADAPVDIVANRMVFGNDGHLAGFDGQLIHSLNKTGHLLSLDTRTRARLEQHRHRTHAIILGDNLSDVKMAHGLPVNDVVSVGFLNDRVDDRLEDYARNFDIVITHDGSMRVVEQLIEHAQHSHGVHGK